MFDFFETIYNRNIRLILDAQQMNGAVISDAAKIREILTLSDESQETLLRLRAEYQNVNKKAAELRELEIQSKETINSLKNQITEFKKTVEVKEAEGTNDQSKQIEKLRAEIQELQQECESSKNDIKQLQLGLKKETRELELATNLNMKYREEYEQNKGCTDLIDENIEEMRVNNRQTKIDLETVNKESEELKEIISDTSAYDDQLAKNKRLEIIAEQLKTDIVGIHAQHDKILINCSKKQKILKKIQKDSNVKEEQYKEQLLQFKRREEQLIRLSSSIADLDRESKQEIPVYKKLSSKYGEIAKSKEEVRQRSNELQAKLYEAQMKFSKSDTENHGKVRMVSANKLELTQTEHKKKEEDMKTLEVVGQKQSLIYEQMVSKQKTCDMKRKIDIIETEIEENLNARKLSLQNYAVIADDAKNNLQESDRLIEELGKIRKESELQNSLIEKVKEERNSLKKQYEMSVQDHQQLKVNYKELIDSISSMTERVEQLTHMTEHDHFFASEMKTAIYSLQEMRTKCCGGIKITQKVILNLQDEEQTLKKIIDQTSHDHAVNLKELEILNESKTELQNQIAEKIRQIAQYENDTKTYDSLLEKRAKDFDAIMTRISNNSNELDQLHQQTVELQQKVQDYNLLRIHYEGIKDNMVIAKVKKTALYQESAKPRGFHRWSEIDAYDHERFMNIKLVEHLRDELHRAHETYKKLIDKRDHLQEEVNSMKVAQEEAMPASEAAIFLDALNEDLKQKNHMIRVIKDKIDETNNGIGSTQNEVKSVRQSISQRKGVAFDLKTTLTETSRSARSQRLAEEDEGNNPYFITEPPFVQTNKGGGFKPRPPRSPRHEIPRIKIEEIQPLNRPPPPSSQRYQRPNLGTLRKKLTKPIQTPRLDRSSRRTARSSVTVT